MTSDKPSAAPPPGGAKRDLLKSLLWFVPAYMIFYFLSEPFFDWMLANPVAGVAVIGLVSFAVFGTDAARNWRDGSDVARGIRQRMTQNPLADTQSLRGLYVIVTGLVIVWLSVLAFGLAEVSDAKRPIFILTVGGITAFLAAPFALYPAALLFGALSRSGGFEAHVVFHLAHPVPDALVRRADLTGMPPSSGFGPAEKADDGLWRSNAVTLAARLFAIRTDYRVEAAPGRLTIDAVTGKDDRECVVLEGDGETRINAALSFEARSAWTRAVLRIAGPRSVATTFAASEAARLTRMLGVTVTAEPPKLA